ncbi:MAG: DUF3142 domain-containing protein, partial [Acidobacteria bacterium]|nr:DUF3142 domain-containing protein [Acidobacteriota bacterium]
SWPDELPRANEYWAVFRVEEPGIPDGGAAKHLVREVADLQKAAARRGLRLSGIQLDIDSPTSQLHDYAVFLRLVKNELPKGVALSITGLLDWFRPGTAVAEVVAAVDEFVPQFYDTEHSLGHGKISTQIQAAKWGPQFNRFGKRYKIGISTFGRARVAAPAGGRGTSSMYISPDLAPRDIALAPGFELDASTNPSGERILRYKATRKTQVGYQQWERGTQVEFVLATRESVQAALVRARQLGGNCTGVIFFRWPTPGETMALPPEVVLAVVEGKPDAGSMAEVRVEDRKCAAVQCVDLTVRGIDPWSPTAVRYHVESSGEIDYFMPVTNSPARMAGPSRLEVTIPPYVGVSQLRLGRAVASVAAKYTLKEAR